MFLPLKNTPMRYAWGANGAISDLLGTGGVVSEPEPGSPVQAELWLGGHHVSPTRLHRPEQADGAATLAEWVRTTPATVLGAVAAGVHPDRPHLPYLMKVLAIARPLSLQVHPSLAQARAGFAAENAAGIPLDAPHRNYRDPVHKPELLVALSERLTALAGFAEQDAVAALLASVQQAAPDNAAFVEFAARANASGADASARRELLAWVLAGGAAVQDAAAAIDAWVRSQPAPGPAANPAPVDPTVDCTIEGAVEPAIEGAAAPTDSGDQALDPADPAADPAADFPVQRDNLARIRAAFPTDASALIALLMNHVTLHRGEALSVSAGVLHAYLEGIGVEVMAASDNVLRGGLTPKHVDVPELLNVLDTTPAPAPLLAPSILGNVATFAPAEPDFMLQRACAEHLDDHLDCTGPGIALCVAGSVQLEGDGTGTAKQLGRGDAVFITADEGGLRVRGRGDVLLATINSRVISGDTP